MGEKKEKKKRKPLHKSTIHILVLAAILAITGLSFSYAYKWGTHQAKVEAEAETDVFKTFDLDTLDGGRFSYKDSSQSQYTAFNVWGTFCPPCIEELPALEQVNNSFDDKDFRVVGIIIDVTKDGTNIIDERIEDAHRIVDGTKITFTNVIPDPSMFEFLNSTIVGTPTTFIVNSNGEIVDVITGARDLTFWQNKAESLVNEGN